ncbi:MAG: ATP-grasp domain-containing protein [Acidobacteriia bacterium]|nr:ATP-grasp domain-containing protein [Terriglobia bacterium]
MRVLLATTCVPDDRKTLAAVRALAGVAAVTVGSDRFLGEAYYSRFGDGRVRYPHPAKGVAAFVETLASQLRRLPHDVLLPMGDYACVAISQRAATLEALTRLVTPAYEALEISRDKEETGKLARRLGLQTPETHCPKDEAELRALAAQIRYPCVVKLRRGAGAVGMSIAQNAPDLLRRFAAPRPSEDLVFGHGSLLVQEHVQGEVHDVCVLFRHGEPRAALTQRRLRMHPNSGGVGTLVETTQQEWLLEQAVALLRALRWHGPAQVEFMVDRQAKRACLLEINGRFWGTLGLSIAAGINFPLLACRMALEGDVEPCFRYQSGLRYRWPWPFGILDTLGRGHRWPSFREFFGPSRGTQSDLWFSDPLPHLAEIAFAAGRLYKRKSLRSAQRATSWEAV